jgi:hypothetical protein
MIILENEEIKKYMFDFIEYFKNNSEINNIYTYDLDSLKMIYTDKININLHHSNELLDYILHNLEFIIIDKDYNIVTYLEKYRMIDEINKKNIIEHWNECEVFKNYIGVFMIFFKHNSIEYYCTKYKIHHYENSFIEKFTNNIFDRYEENNTPINRIFISQRFKNIFAYDENFNLLNNVIFSIDSAQNDSKLFYSCFDELDFEHNESIKKMESNKKLFNAGYLIKYNGYMYILPNKLYEKINNLLPKYSNLNKIYLELYKSDNLNFVINYISLYPSDIIKRINLSMKTLSKEYLNIYHLTRKKSHPEVYEKLDEINKKILYDLHTIFIETRKNEFIINNDIADKKSLTVEIVYKYLKKVDIDILEKIYLNRNNLINLIKNVFNNDSFKIFFEDCINTKTISYLLNKNY